MTQTALKPTFAHLEAIKLLIDYPGAVFVVSSGIHSRGLDLMKNRDGSERIAVLNSPFRDSTYPKVTSAILQSLKKFGWVQRVDQKEFPENKRSGRGHYSWNENGYELSKVGREAWETLRPKWEKEIKKREDASNAVNRLVVLKPKSSRWNSMEGRPRYGALCKVVRETDKRLYLQLVWTPDNDSSPDYWTLHSMAEGSVGNYYCNREDVALNDFPSLIVYKKLMEIEYERLNEITRYTKEQEDEIRPILNRYESRRLQQDAMYDEMTADLIKGTQKK